MDESFRHYLAQLKERRPEIADFLLRCEKDHLVPEDFRAMRNCVRSLLSLTAGEHAPQLHILAQTMQEALDPVTPAARIDLIALGRILLGACNDALTMLPGGTRRQSAFPPPSSFAPSRRPLLLTVDDDRIIRSMIEGMFGAHMSVLTAQDGKEGLEIIRSRRPDLVLLDDAMPHITGLKLIELLHADKDTYCGKVVMLTSSDRAQDIKRAMAAGAADYIIKPFDPAVLAEKIYTALSEIN